MNFDVTELEKYCSSKQTHKRVVFFIITLFSITEYRVTQPRKGKQKN